MLKTAGITITPEEQARLKSRIRPDELEKTGLEIITTSHGALLRQGDCDVPSPDDARAPAPHASVATGQGGNIPCRWDTV